MLYLASADGRRDEAADEEEEDEGMERPAHAEAVDVPALPSSAAAASVQRVPHASRGKCPTSRAVVRLTANTCPQCNERVIIGQYICQHCNKNLRSRIPHDTARRNLAAARPQFVGNIATPTGKAVAPLRAVM